MPCLSCLRYVRHFLTIALSGGSFLSGTAWHNERMTMSLGGSLPKKALYCSFCFKSQHEVRRLIAGPAAVYICDGCIGLCNEIIAGPQRGQSKTASPKE